MLRNDLHMTIDQTASLRSDIATRIVERISASVQKHIFVTDASGAMVASSNGASSAAIRDIALQAIAAGALVRKPNEIGSIVGLPLVHNQKIAGAIVLDAITSPNDDVAHMARSLAELIIHQMMFVEQLPHQTWAREKFLFDLLHGRLSSSPDIALQEAALLELDLAKPRVVALVAFENEPLDGKNEGPRSTLPVIEQRLRNARHEAELLAFARQALDTRSIDIASFIGSRWLVLLPIVDPAAPDRARRDTTAALKRFLERLGRERQERATAGLGRYYDSWLALAQSFSDARFALEIGREIYGVGQVYLPGNLGVASLVCSNDAVLKTQLAEHLVQQLAQDPELMHTLDVFIDSNLSPSAAAKRLQIHRHTLAHRLDKITRLAGLDPRQFHELAQLHAALVLYRTCMHPTHGPKPPSQGPT
jgi:carbohydrate diacid regulator